MRILLCTSLLSSLLFVACGQKSLSGSLPAANSPTLRGSRSFGIDFSNLSETGSFTENISATMSLKAQALSLVLDWSQIETSVSSFTDPSGILAQLNSTLPQQSLQLSLTIAAIDSTTTATPTDLTGTAFNNTTLIARYNAMIDYVLGQLSSVTIINLQIANDVDSSPLTADASFWSQWTTFTTQVTTHLHTVRPTLKVGFTVTAPSAQGSLVSSILSASAGADLIGINYFPMTVTYNAQAPELTESDFDRIVSAYSSMPVYFQAVGYPSSATAGSTETKQAQFYANVFVAWDKYSTQIPFLSVTRLVDISHADAVSAATTAGLGGKNNYIAFIESMGLRTYTSTGTDKSAITNIQSYLNTRSW